MIVTVYLPLLAVVALGGVASVVGRHLRPAAATWVLAVVAVVGGAGTVGALALLTVGGLLRLLTVFDSTSRSAAAGVIASVDSVPWALGLASIAVLGVCGVRVGAVMRSERSTRAALRAVVAGHRDELLVLDDITAYAYAAHPDTIVVSTAMLTTLGGAERRAMLAHERAHLTDHHHRFRLITRLARAVNPALATVDREIRFQTERWADERAAAATTRTVAAHSLARAALASRGCPPDTALAYAQHSVTDRVTALSTTPRPDRWLSVMPTVTVAVAALGCLVDATGACWRLLEMLP